MEISLTSLSPEVQQFIRDELAKGTYDSAEAMVEFVLTREAEQRGKVTLDQSVDDETSRVNRFLEHLYRIGLLREVRTIGNETAFDDFEPIRIDGPPLSQTIIEDRR